MAAASSPMVYSPTDVLDFLFPDTGHQNTPETLWFFSTERMLGGMGAAIISKFADIAHAAAFGRLATVSLNERVQPTFVVICKARLQLSQVLSHGGDDDFVWLSGVSQTVSKDFEDRIVILLREPPRTSRAVAAVIKRYSC